MPRVLEDIRSENKFVRTGFAKGRLRSGYCIRSFKSGRMTRMLEDERANQGKGKTKAGKRQERQGRVAHMFLYWVLCVLLCQLHSCVVF